MREFLHDFLRSLYIMRHGPSEANAQGIIISAPELGAAAYGLTVEGQHEVTRRVDRFKTQNDLDLPGEIYSSPFLRARDTAAIASKSLGWPIVAEATALRERFFGDLDQLDDTHYAQVWAQDEQDPAHTRWHVESACQVRDRVTTFLKELQAGFQGRPTLLVTHGDTASICLAALRNKELGRHRSVAALATAEIQRCCPSV